MSEEHPPRETISAEARIASFFDATARLTEELGAARELGTVGPIAEEKILFRATPSLGFPASDVTAIRFKDASEGAWPAEMDVAFLGLYGPSSPLPPSWTERIVMDEEGAANLRDLLDLFDHPAIALAYRIWRHYRLELHFRPEAFDAGSRAALALAGVFPEGITGDPDLDPLRLLPIAGLLAQHARSGALLCQIVSEYFNVPVAIEEWVRRMAPIPCDQQFRLGEPWVAIGRTTLLGEAVPDVMGAVTVVLGPLSAQDFESFLPGGPARKSLRALLRLAVREPLECRIDLVMDDDAPAGLTLGSGRLGWTTWQEAPGALRRCPTGPV